MHIPGISRLQEVIRKLAGYDRKGECGESTFTGFVKNANLLKKG